MTTAHHAYLVAALLLALFVAGALWWVVRFYRGGGR